MIILVDYTSKEYERGIKAFLENDFPIYAKGKKMKCRQSMR